MITWGLLFQEFIEFVVLALFIWLVFMTFSRVKSSAKSYFLKKDNSFAEWSNKNGGGRKVVSKDHKD